MENFNINKLSFILCSYELPFALDLKNCFNSKEEGEAFVIKIDEIPVQLRVERKYADRVSGGITMGPFSKMENDRYGFLSKTKVQIWFDKQIFDNVGIDREAMLESGEYFFKLSIKYLNKFLMNYRSVTREYWIRPIKKQNIFRYQHVLLDSKNQARTCFCELHNLVKYNDGKEISISKGKEKELRRQLSSSEHDLADDLLLSALDNLDLDNFNNTIIQCSILFENFIYTSLENKLSKTKLDKIKRKIDCNCLVGIYQVCTTGLKSEFDSNFGDSKEFINFHQKVLKIRNDLVHGKKIDNIEYKDAKNAINITLDTIEKFKNDLNKV